MHAIDYFKTTIWSEEKPEYIKSLNKASDKYIKQAKARDKNYIKKHGDFGKSYHSTSLTNDNDFRDFINYVGRQSWNYLDEQGYDMSQYSTMLTDMWVQEFAKKGGGNHAPHIHANQHVSGFYFLKCSDKTSNPIFYDPRAAARATKLKMKSNVQTILGGHEQFHLIPKPGTLIIFPGFLEHGYTIDHGLESFRFLHWHLQAVPKKMAREDV